ncbi:oligosaccharyl transferase stt3 subunit [Linnemannia zychae]|nr:oligosaccharyl transferase stt3 subunit [Linnemannia zychae]
MSTESSSTIAQVLKPTILILIAIVAISSRLFSIIRFESVIHEFDPWFNYRTTQRLFSLIEIGMGYAWGPLQPKSQYGSFGYNTNAQVIVVSPEQPQSQQMMQTVYPPQPQNLYYQPLLPQQQQQGSHLVSPLPLSGAEGVSSAQGVVAQPYQQTEQQHQYRSFAQPAPFLQQQSVAGSPSPQPSPGATASSVGTQQYSPAAVPSHTPAST